MNSSLAARRDPWVTNGGWEYPVVLATVGATIALTGPGSVSVDHALGLDWTTAWGVGGVALGVAAAIATLLLRRPPATPASEAGGNAHRSERWRRCRPRPSVIRPSIIRSSSSTPPGGRPTSSSASPTRSPRSPARCRSSTSTPSPSPAGCCSSNPTRGRSSRSIVSLEAIFLSTFVMIGQNRQAEFQRAKADHDFTSQEQELPPQHRAHPCDPHADDRDPPARRRRTIAAGPGRDPSRPIAPGGVDAADLGLVCGRWCRGGTNRAAFQEGRTWSEARTRTSSPTCIWP